MLYSKKVKSPCYKCEDREVGCHGKCEKYQEYAGITEEHRATRNEEASKARGLHTKQTHTQLKRAGRNKEKW